MRGHPLDNNKILRVLHLLRTTELSQSQIGARLAVPKATVNYLNLKFHIRPKEERKNA